MSAEQGPRPDVDIFVDTNVLIYAVDGTSGSRYTTAAGLVARLWETRRGCLSIQVLQEFAAVSTQRIPQPLSLERCATVVGSLAAWRCHRPSPNDVLQALELRKQHGVSIWDAMILRSAEQLGCTELWSEDFQADRNYGSVTVVNPF